MRGIAKYLTQSRRQLRRKLDALLLLLLVAMAPAAWAGNETQPLVSITSAARAYGAERAAQEGIKDARVTTGRLDPRLRLAACGSALTTFSNQPNQQLRNIAVGVRCDGPAIWTIYVPVTLSWETNVVTLRSARQRGAILAEKDLKIVRREAAASYVPHLERLEDAVGKELTRSLGAGTLLTTAMVTNTSLVRRGERVTLVVERGGLKVTSSGTAESDGAIGEKVLVKNAYSSRQVEGSVQEDGSVRVFN